LAYASATYFVSLHFLLRDMAMSLSYWAFVCVYSSSSKSTCQELTRGSITRRQQRDSCYMDASQEWVWIWTFTILTWLWTPTCFTLSGCTYVHLVWYSIKHSGLTHDARVIGRGWKHWRQVRHWLCLAARTHARFGYYFVRLPFLLVSPSSQALI
jgi:hypothetical protein